MWQIRMYTSVGPGSESMLRPTCDPPPSRLSRKGLHHIRMHLRDKVGMNLMVVDQIGGEHIMTIRTWWWNAISECRAGGIKGLLINRNGCSCPARHPRSLII